MIYESLYDFVSKTSVALNTDGKAVVITNYYKGYPITLIGFRADPDQSDFEIQEEGYNYFLNLEQEVNKRKV